MTANVDLEPDFLYTTIPDIDLEPDFLYTAIQGYNNKGVQQQRGTKRRLSKTSFKQKRRLSKNVV